MASSQEWYTPDNLFDRIEQMLGGHINLDPCSNELKTVRAENYFTAQDDGLLQIWGRPIDFGLQRRYWLPFRVFLNPPWSNMGPWVQGTIERYDAGQFSDAALLVPARTETKWYRLMSERFSVCHPSYRIRYVRYEPGEGFVTWVWRKSKKTGLMERVESGLDCASHFFYVGRNIDRFASAAEADGFGRVFVPYKSNWRIA